MFFLALWLIQDLVKDKNTVIGLKTRNLLLLYQLQKKKIPVGDLSVLKLFYEKEFALFN